MHTYFITVKRGMNVLLNKVMVRANNRDDAKRLAQELYYTKLHENQRSYSLFNSANHVEIANRKGLKVSDSLISCLHLLDTWEDRETTKTVNIF